MNKTKLSVLHNVLQRLRAWPSGAHQVLTALATAACLWAGPLQAQQVLTVAAFPAVDDIVRAAVPAWKKLHPNVEIKVVSRQFSDHHTAMTTALSTRSYLPDVMALEVGYVGRFSQGNGLENLSAAPYNIQTSRARYVAYAYQQGSNSKGELVAAPSDIGPGTLLYRADILEKAGVKPEELTQSWDSYVASGVRIKQSTGAYLLAHARDMKDILIRIDIKPGEGLYFGSKNQVLVNSPRFERAFTLAKKIRDEKLDAKVNAWSNDWSEGFRRGAISTQLTGAWLAGHMNNWLAPDTKGKWRAADLPEGASVAYGGAFLAIPKAANAANKALAWDLIKMLTQTSELQLAAFKTQDAFPALLDVHQDTFFEQPIEFLGGQKARLLWRDAASRITAVTVHRQDSFAEEVINTELDKVLNQGKAIKTALADAERLLKRRANR